MSSYAEFILFLLPLVVFQRFVTVVAQFLLPTRLRIIVLLPLCLQITFCFSEKWKRAQHLDTLRATHTQLGTAMPHYIHVILA